MASRSRMCTTARFSTRVKIQAKLNAHQSMARQKTRLRMLRGHALPSADCTTLSCCNCNKRVCAELLLSARLTLHGARSQVETRSPNGMRARRRSCCFTLQGLGSGLCIHAGLVIGCSATNSKPNTPDARTQSVLERT